MLDGLENASIEMEEAKVLCDRFSYYVVILFEGPRPFLKCYSILIPG